MIEMLIGVAVGYIAFTENGHKIGNAVAGTISDKTKELFEQTFKNNKKE